MEFGGKYLIGSQRSLVWEALNDTDILKEAIPGCEKIEWVSEAALEAAIAVNLGVAKPTFVGDLVLSDIAVAEKYTLSGRGRGGLLGRVQGAADIELSDHADGTKLVFTAAGDASGTIMRLGRAMIGSSAQKVIDGFFIRFATAMGAEISTYDGR